MRRRYLSLSEGLFIDLSKDYFAVEFLEDNSYITLNKGEHYNAEDYYYCDNNKSWTPAKTNSIIRGNKGLKIYFKGNLTLSKYDDYDGIGLFEIPNKCNISGNILSLVYSDDFESINDLTIDYISFKSLFKNCSVIDASQLKLSALILSGYCYSYMFQDCTLLITPPELPATTLDSRCYALMFSGCTSLISAPTLPATTMKESCYASMFSGCTSLVTAPSLPATVLDEQCYASMFSGCTSLVTAPTLPATTLVYYCYSTMFSNCTSLVTAPELLATELVNRCYRLMFKGCSSLNYIKALFTTTPSSTYTSDWVSGVSSTGTFVKNKDATWNVTGVHGVPTGWTVQTASS